MHCPELDSVFSGPGNSQLQGVIRREWLVLFKDDNTADGCFPARPKGSPNISQLSLLPPNMGADIICKLPAGASETDMQFRTVH